MGPSSLIARLAERLTNVSAILCPLSCSQSLNFAFLKHEMSLSITRVGNKPRFSRPSFFPGDESILDARRVHTINSIFVQEERIIPGSHLPRLSHSCRILRFRCHARYRDTRFKSRWNLCEC